jgi:D-lactate dehydrogenase
MCCGSPEQLRTLAGMRVMLADGSVLDTEDALSKDAFQNPRRPARRTGAPGARHRANAKLAERIRHKFKIKNTTGYSLNALVDFEDPIDILPT